MLSIAKWSTADAARSQLDSFGGHEGGELDCSSQFGGGFGALEQPGHNTMHDSYVGGDMADPSVAVLDPIFYSFHCYIDLLWAQWQEQFETDTDLDARLCGLFKDREHLPENRFRVKDTLDTKAQLGYVYEYTPGPPPPTPQSVLEAVRPFPAHPAFDFVVSARKRPEIVRALDVTIPAPGFSGAQLVLSGMNVHTPFSYSADVYLTPAGEELRLDDREFRATHLVDLLYIWKAHHGGGDGHSRDLVVDLNAALMPLSETHAGERWRVSVALGASETRAPAQGRTGLPRQSPQTSRRGHGLRRPVGQRLLRRTTMAEDQRPPVFELHIRPMFRLLDREHMLTFIDPGLDLWNLEHVWTMRNDILVRLRGRGARSICPGRGRRPVAGGVDRPLRALDAEPERRRHRAPPPTRAAATATTRWSRCRTSAGCARRSPRRAEGAKRGSRLNRSARAGASTRSISSRRCRRRHRPRPRSRRSRCSTKPT